MKALGLGTAIALGIAGSAYAADIGVIQPVVSPEYQHPLHQQTGTSWSGLYAGAHVGYGAGTSEGCGVWAGGGVFNPIPSPCSGGNSYPVLAEYNGWLGGGQIGVKHQWEHFVVGAELAGSVSKLLHESFNQANPNVVDVRQSVDWLASATVNAGVAFDAVLLYGLIGYGAGHIDHANDPGPGGGGGCYFNTGVSGLVYGAGIQAKVTSNVSLFGEWNRYDFGKVNVRCVDVNNAGNNIDFNTTVDTFKVGANFWFGGHQQTGAVSVGY